MDFSFATFAALFLLFAAASCAPTGHSLQGACADARSSSLKLNHIARIVSVKARNGFKDVANFSTSLVWMEEKDRCDPEALREKSAPCVGKILDVLSVYISAVERVSGFPSCAEYVSQVKPAMQTLHDDASKCVKSEAGMTHQKHIRNEETQPIARWQEAPLCRYTLDRLFSFSILTARVFAFGDAAQHAGGSAQNCM